MLRRPRRTPRRARGNAVERQDGPGRNDHVPAPSGTFTRLRHDRSEKSTNRAVPSIALRAPNSHRSTRSLDSRLPPPQRAGRPLRGVTGSLETERQSDRYAQCGAGREPGAERERGRDPAPAASARSNGCDHSCYVPRPGWIESAQGLVIERRPDVNLCSLHFDVRPEDDQMARIRLEQDVCTEIDCHWHGQAVGVIGVVANQVHPTRAVRPARRWDFELGHQSCSCSPVFMFIGPPEWTRWNLRPGAPPEACHVPGLPGLPRLDLAPT